MPNIFDNTWTPGFLEAIEDRNTIDYLKDVRTQLRETMLANYEPNKLKQQTEFNAICLRQMRTSTINGKNVIRVKARIPEIHTMIPIPKSATDFRTMSLYPTFIGLKTDFSPNINPGSIIPGTRLTVSFDQMANFAGPILKKVFDIRPGTAESTSSKSANRNPLDWVQITTNNLHQIPAPRPIIQVGNTAPAPRLSHSGVRLHLIKNQKRRWGTQKMQDYLDGLRHVPGGEDVYTAAGMSVLRDGWYVQDISKITGGFFGHWGKPDGTPQPADWIFGGHASHQSGIDADISIPLIMSRTSALTGVPIINYEMTIKPTGTSTNLNWKFLPKSNAKNMVDNLDLAAILAFLKYSAGYCKLILLEPEFLARIYEGHPNPMYAGIGSTAAQRGAADYASQGIDGWDAALLQRLFGAEQAGQPSRAGGARVKLRNGKYIKGGIFSPDYGSGGRGHGHSNHFHIRLQGQGAGTDTNGDGKLLAKADTCQGTSGNMRYKYIDLNGANQDVTCQVKGFHTETVTN